MFDFFKKKQKAGETVSFNITGMHCVSCALNIDGELEDLDGVTSAQTNYAQSRTKVTYNPEKVTKENLKRVIESLAYSVEESAE